MRPNSFGGRVNYEVEWGYLYDNDCKICKLKNECNGTCKHKTPCKLYVIKAVEGVVRIKRICKNAKLPIRGTEGVEGYDLATAQVAVIPAHGKVLVKTSLSMGLPSSCYGRVAPRSGLALKRFIDVGAALLTLITEGSWR